MYFKLQPPFFETHSKDILAERNAIIVATSSWVTRKLIAAEIET